MQQQKKNKDFFSPHHDHTLHKILMMMTMIGCRAVKKCRKKKHQHNVYE